jgi:lipooligosaccharide transport system ATP-binding protein
MIRLLSARVARRKWVFMILARQLEKSFGPFRAVDQMNLEIRKGECFGLLGPNGAGKSTFISLVYGAALRTSGDLKVFGYDPGFQSREIKKRLGVVTQDNALDESLTVMENMLLYCAFLGIPKSERRGRIEELLEYMNLSHKKEAEIQALSGGMKRRLVFVRALLGKPEVLILDEPTTGLDPAVRHLLWGKVRELHQAGTTIVLTTHYMHEAEVLCDRLVILNAGKIVAEGSPSSMIETHAPGYVGIFDLADRDRVLAISAKDAALHSHEDASGFYLRAPALEQLTALHSEHKIRPLQIRPSNLEDVFLKLTGQGLAEDA